MTIVNIRGTNGSGKTHIVRSILIDAVVANPIYESNGKKPKIMAYEIDHPQLEHDLYIVGRYDVACGGADTLPKPKGSELNSMDVVEQLVRRYAPHGDVLFEGLIVSSVWGRWVQLAKEFPTVFVFLDTPMEVCHKRVLERNGGKPLKNEEKGLDFTHLGSVWHRCQGHYRQGVAGGLDCRMVPYERAEEAVLAALQEEVGVRG